MSINIVEIIMSRLGGNNMNQLGSLLGESPDRTKSAAGAAVPALLAGLGHVSSTPEGAHRITNAINQQDPNLDENYSAALTDTSKINPETSSNLLTNLFGAGLSTNLTSILGRYTGMKTGSVTSLMGAITPLALSVIGKQQRASGAAPDASGLSGFFASQKQNIAAAMPSGLSNVLGTIPGFGGYTAPQKPTEKLPEAAPELAHAGKAPAFAESTSGPVPSETERRPEYTRREQPSPTHWLIPLIIIAALVWAFYAWNRSRNVNRTTEPVPSATQPMERNQPPGSTAPQNR